MKRVIILSDYFPDHAHPSNGIFILEQAKELVKHADVAVISPIAVPLPRKKFRTIREIQSCIPLRGSLGGVKFFRPRYFDWPRFSNYLNAYGVLLAVITCCWRNRLEPDLIHAHFAHQMGYVGALLAKWLKKPLITTVHGSDIFIRPQFAPDRKRILYALNKSSKIIAVSNALKNEVLNMGISEEKIETISNGVDENLFKPMDKILSRKRLGLPVHEKIIMYVGNLHQVKGVLYLIRACSELKDNGVTFSLVIVGDGPERMKLMAEVGRLRLTEYVKFAGAKPHDEVPQWLNACDVFVLPSIHEGFGIILLEALACGKRVVATSTGGIPEVVCNPSLGRLVKPANSTQLAEAITAELNGERNIATLVDYARQHSWRAASSRIYEQYELIT